MRNNTHKKNCETEKKKKERKKKEKKSKSFLGCTTIYDTRNRNDILGGLCTINALLYELYVKREKKNVRRIFILKNVNV